MLRCCRPSLWSSRAFYNIMTFDITSSTSVRPWKSFQGHLLSNFRLSDFRLLDFRSSIDFLYLYLYLIIIIYYYYYYQFIRISTYSRINMYTYVILLIHKYIFFSSSILSFNASDYRN